MIDVRREASWRRRCRPPHCGNPAWAGSARCGSQRITPRRAGRGQLRSDRSHRGGDRVPRESSTRVGAWRTGLARTHSSLSVPESGSGAHAKKETVLKDISYRDEADVATLVIESGRPPPPEVVDKVTGDCGVKPSALTVIYAPTQSLAGATQVVARVLEVALHKAHELKFPLERIVDGMGAAPLGPPHPDFVTVMGRTNDAIIYGGRAQLYVTGPADDAKRLAEALPGGRASLDFGAPFAGEFSSASRAISTPSTPCYSVPPRSSLPRSIAERAFTRARCITNCLFCLVRLRQRRAAGTALASLSSAISATGTRARCGGICGHRHARRAHRSGWLRVRHA